MKSFFYLIDLIMPRAIAILPYKLAFQDLLFQIEEIEGAQLWYRNSCLRGNFVFGISDLDLTIKIKESSLPQLDLIKNILLRHKKRYPFLGEINFYIEEEFLFFQTSLNEFERSRDPYLSKLLTTASIHSHVDKIVFLLRMLYSDRQNLLNFPSLRQKKWKTHLQDVGVNPSTNIDIHMIFNEIINLCNCSEWQQEILEALNFLTSSNFNDVNIFSQQTPYLWKYLFPHKHLWYETAIKDDFTAIQNTVLREICLRQIDWEIWGVMSQLPIISKIGNGIYIHFTRLAAVAKDLNDSSMIIIKITKLIHLSKKSLLQ